MTLISFPSFELLLIQLHWCVGGTIPYLCLQAKDGLKIQD